MERLLPSIHRYFRAGGRYESEDLFTEILAWLLNADTDGRFRRDFAAAFMSSDDDPDLFADAEAASQVTISARSRPDLQLRCNKYYKMQLIARESNSMGLALSCRTRNRPHRSVWHSS